METTTAAIPATTIIKFIAELRKEGHCAYRWREDSKAEICLNIADRLETLIAPCGVVSIWKDTPRSFGHPELCLI